MDCELCMDAFASQFRQTDWGHRHICESCADNLVVSTIQSEQEALEAVSEGFLQDVGVLPTPTMKLRKPR